MNRARVTRGKPDPVDIHVGSRVRLRRTLLGLSQEKLGEALGLTFQQVQKYERGANRIGASRLHQISMILDVPVSFFFEEMPTDVANLAPAGRGQVGDVRRHFLEEEGDRHVEDHRDLVQTAGADSIGATLVFLYLLKGQAERLAELLLAQSEECPPQADATSDMDVDWIWFSTCDTSPVHFRFLAIKRFPRIHHTLY